MTFFRSDQIERRIGALASLVRLPKLNVAALIGLALYMQGGRDHPPTRRRSIAIPVSYVVAMGATADLRAATITISNRIEV